MGTRHLICVFYKGRFVVAQFGQFDGYPEGQGVALVKFLRVPTNIPRLEEGLKHIYEWSGEELMGGPWPSLQRDTSAGILEVIASAEPERKVPIELGLSFANDSVFCEWVYVVDLDIGVFEVFGGAEKKKPGHRFEDVGNEKDTVPALVSSITFSELQSMNEGGFVARVVKDLVSALALVQPNAVLTRLFRRTT